MTVDLRTHDRPHEGIDGDFIQGMIGLVEYPGNCDSAVAEKGLTFDRKTRFLSATRQMSFLDKAKGLVA